MPFGSDAQRAYCWMKFNEELKENIVPAWNCSTYGHHKAIIKKLKVPLFGKKTRKSKTRRKHKR